MKTARGSRGLFDDAQGNSLSGLMVCPDQKESEEAFPNSDDIAEEPDVLEIPTVLNLKRSVRVVPNFSSEAMKTARGAWEAPESDQGGSLSGLIVASEQENCVSQEEDLIEEPDIVEIPAVIPVKKLNGMVPHFSNDAMKTARGARSAFDPEGNSLSGLVITEEPLTLFSQPDELIEQPDVLEVPTVLNIKKKVQICIPHFSSSAMLTARGARVAHTDSQGVSLSGMMTPDASEEGVGPDELMEEPDFLEIPTVIPYKLTARSVPHFTHDAMKTARVTKRDDDEVRSNSLSNVGLTVPESEGNTLSGSFDTALKSTGESNCDQSYNGGLSRSSSVSSNSSFMAIPSVLPSKTPKEKPLPFKKASSQSFVFGQRTVSNSLNSTLDNGDGGSDDEISVMTSDTGCLDIPPVIHSTPNSKQKPAMLKSIQTNSCALDTSTGADQQTLSDDELSVMTEGTACLDIPTVINAVSSKTLKLSVPAFDSSAIRPSRREAGMPVNSMSMGILMESSTENQMESPYRPLVAPLNLPLQLGRKKSSPGDSPVKGILNSPKGPKPQMKPLTLNSIKKGTQKSAFQNKESSDLSAKVKCQVTFEHSNCTTRRSDMTSGRRSSPPIQLKEYKLERRMIPLYADPAIHELVVYLLISLALTADGRNIESLYTSHTNPQQESDNDGVSGFNLLFTLHHHLNHPYNAKLLPGLAARLKAGGHQRYLLFKLLCGAIFDESSYFSGGVTRIASGAFGAVVSVKSPLPVKYGKKGYLAVKSVKRESGPFDRSIASNLFVELSAMSALQDVAQVCKLYDFGVSRDTFHMVMERCKSNLKEWRSKKPKHVSEQDLVLYLQIYAQLLGGLAAMADKGIAHFDLKCDNILLRNNPDEGVYLETIAIADFGEAHVGPSSRGFEEDFLSGNLMSARAWNGNFVNSSMMRARGTECIQSPEMLRVAALAKDNPDKFAGRGAVSIGLASDIWSVGCLLYELMTCTWLFEYEDWSQFFVTLVSDKVPLPPENRMTVLSHLQASSQIEQLLSYILVRIPHRRPRAVDIKQKISLILSSISPESAILSTERFPEKQEADMEGDSKDDSFELCRYPAVDCWLTSKYDTFSPLPRLYFSSSVGIMEMLRSCSKDDDQFDSLCEFQTEVVINARDLPPAGITHIINFEQEEAALRKKSPRPTARSPRKFQRSRTASSLCPSLENTLTITFKTDSSSPIPEISVPIGKALEFLKKHHSQDSKCILLVGGEIACCTLLAYVMVLKKIEMYEAVVLIRNTYPGFWVSKAYIMQLQIVMSNMMQTCLEVNTIPSVS